MTKRKLRVPDLPPESIGSVRDLDAVDAIFKRVFRDKPPAVRREFAPVGFVNKVRWAMGKILFTEAAL
jgi:hypothetical protein